MTELMFHFTILPPLSLYIHIPWCVKKCPYCDFNSHTLKRKIPEQDYIDALILDLEQELPFIWGRPILSIFIGGGTPSLFTAQAIDTLLSQLRARLNLLPDIEITLEANPGTLEQGKFSEFRAAGINRLSIGIQSFQPELLKRIGRIHDEIQAIAAAEAAHAAGFDTFNLDLMYGLPGQTTAEALADIEQAISLQPWHISHYQLTLEPETAFYKQPPVLPTDDRIATMLDTCMDTLHQHHYYNYEISAYAQKNHQCLHNLNYWRFGDYLGIGAGAHSKISLPTGQGIIRKAKLKQPQLYIQHCHSGTPVETQTKLNREDVILEFMMNTLRLTEGFDPRLMLEHGGIPISTAQRKLVEAEAKGLLEWNMNHIKPTKKGQRFLNDLIGLFIE